MYRIREVANRLTLMGLATVVALALSTSAFAASKPQSAAGKVYAVNVLTSFGTTFTDCFRFSETALGIDGCGDSGPFSEQNLFGTTFVAGFGAHVPCAGLNLVWFGTTTDGAGFGSGQGADVIGGTAVGESEGTTFSINGIASLSCPNSSARNGVNYTKPTPK